MSGSTKAIVAEIHALAREVRHASLGFQPPPWKNIPANIDAEQDVCSLLLGGYRSADQLAPLQPQHFYASLFQNIFAAAQALGERGEVCSLETVAAELERRGMIGPILEELVQVRDTTPMISQLQLRRRIAEIMDLAARRRLVELLHRTELAVRDGELDCDGARAELEAFWAEVFG